MKLIIHSLASFPIKTAFVTGAASGLGAEFARMLASHGWKLVLTDNDNLGLQKITKELQNQNTEVHVYNLDVSNYKEYQLLAKELEAQSIQIDLLINNAGIGDGNLFSDYDHREWMKMININLIGVYHGCKLLLPFLLNQRKSLIINIGSAAGFMNAPGMSAYNVTKAGVYALSETLYHELKSQNVHVSVATPTFFKTNIMHQAKGRQSMVDFAHEQMNRSRTTASETADYILRNATNGKFQILWPGEAKRHHFLKKWFPKLIERQFEKLLSGLNKKAV